jgi:hypothetical protein
MKPSAWLWSYVFNPDESVLLEQSTIFLYLDHPGFSTRLISGEIEKDNQLQKHYG